MRWFALLGLVSACPSPSPGTPDAGFRDVSLDPTNATGYQFQTPVYTVPEGKEYQDCWFVAMPDLNAGQDYYMDRFRLGALPGTHHVNVFRVKTIVHLDGAPGTMVHGEDPRTDECFKSGNWSDWPLVVNSQQSDAANPYYDWHLPGNVAHRFSPGEKLMVQVHYVNASTQDTPANAHVVLDMYRSQAAAPVELGTLFATEQSIRICQSNPNPTYHGTCLFNSGGTNIVAANGHFHSRGVSFSVYQWDGVSTTQPPPASMFYSSDHWDHPDMHIYSPVLNDATGGVWWTCEFQWMPPDPAAGGCDAVNARDPSTVKDCCYTFGPVVETSEHCNLFLYYYPKVAASDITCF